MSLSEASLTSLRFRRLRAVSRLLGLDIVVDDDELVLAPAAAERSLTWSSGQVTRPETFDVRTGAAEPGGLCCPAIFADEPACEAWRSCATDG